MEFIQWVSLFFVSGGLCCVYKWIKAKQTRPKPPGPRGVAAFRNFVNAARNYTLHHYAEDLSQRYGKVVMLSLFNTNVVFLNTIDLMRKCFCDERYKMVTNHRPETFASSFIFKNENIAFSPPGKRHTRLRRLVHSSLKTYGDGIEIFEDTIMSELKVVVKDIESKSSSEVEIEDILSKAMLNIIHILLTAERIDQNDAILEKMKGYNSTITNLFGPEIDLSLTMMPFLRHMPGAFRSICDNASAKMEDLVKVLYEPRKSSYTHEEARGLIQRGLETTESLNGCSDVTEDHVKMLMLEIISAAYLTTRGTLLGLMLILMELPDLQERVYELIRETIGDRCVTPGDRAALPYIDAMIIEALRYLTHGPFSLPHKTTEDIELEGYHVPKNSTIMVNLWALGHDERVWDEPWEFRPERFLDGQGDLLPIEHPVRQRCIFFGVGIRHCPGEVFAKNRLFLFITTLIQHFRFLPPEGGMTSSADPRTWVPGMVLQPESFNCRVELRDTRPLSRNKD